jgi:hypothetical protein
MGSSFSNRQLDKVILDVIELEDVQYLQYVDRHGFWSDAVVSLHGFGTRYRVLDPEAWWTSKDPELADLKSL